MYLIKWPGSIGWRFTATLLLLVGAQTIQAQQSSSQLGASTAEERGKQHFVTYMCYSCHGFTGQGGQTDVAPRINVDRLSAEALAAYTRNPGGRMPPYRTEEQIPDAALRDIYAYLKSLPPSPAPEDIPLLNE
jgi:mono/diheme cytochrome c family protein